MQIGRLRHLIEIWKYTETQDEYGEPIKSYELVGKTWAEIRPLLGNEHFYEKEMLTNQTHRIFARYLPLDLDATMQIRYDDRVFEVMGQPSNYMERNINWVFRCKEVFDETKYGHTP